MLTIDFIVTLANMVLRKALLNLLVIFGIDMQDNNLEHMEYLLTKAAYENWVLEMSAADMFKYFTKANIKSLQEFYLKEHGLPLGSEIKE